MQKDKIEPSSSFDNEGGNSIEVMNLPEESKGQG